MASKLASLDAANRRILGARQLNGAVTNQQLAEMVNLSASACHGRVRALEEAGIIRRYLADLDIEKLPPSLSAIVNVSLASHRPEDFRSFEGLLAEIPEIVWSYKTSGNADYLMLVVVPDMAALRRLTDGLLEAGTAIANLTTTMVIERVKNFAGLPLQTLFAAEQADE